MACSDFNVPVFEKWVTVGYRTGGRANVDNPGAGVDCVSRMQGARSKGPTARKRFVAGVGTT